MKIKLFNGKYEVGIECSNCRAKSIIRIPKGTTIKSFIARKGARCENCGCIINEKGGSEDEQESTNITWTGGD